MKVIVIGSQKVGNVIQGKVRIGQEVVIRHKGKVAIGTVVRTKRYSKTEVSYDVAAVMVKAGTSRAKGPISKGLGAEIIALSSSQM
jgi:hypothetical protein